MATAGQALSDAFDRIAAARESGATELDLSLQRLPIIPEEIEALSGLQDLTLDGTEVSDLTPLQGLVGLQSLDLDDTQVTDLTSLQGLAGLQTLYLDNTPVTDLRPLQGLTGLQTLGLNGTLVTDIAPLQGLSELQSLFLNGTPVTDLTPLQGLAGLQRLTLGSTLVTDLTPLQGLSGLQSLFLDGTPVTDLTPLQGITGLRNLTLDGTPVTDLTPLQGLTGLRNLTLDGTPVTDLTPLQGLSGLQDLDLDNTQVLDLRPIRDLHFDVMGSTPVGLHFTNTPAAGATPELTRLSEIEDHADRTRETLAYLRTLPPYPEPAPWDEGGTQQGGSDRTNPPDPELTITALLNAQEPAGWRFSPVHGAMVLYVQDTPEDQRQAQLAQISADRLRHLLNALGNRTNAGGIREEVHEEADRFGQILDDDGRSLSARSLELWASLIALGGLLDANDAGRISGRDPLDLLSVEARASLQTFLAIAGNLVRSFPEARALDEGQSGFARRAVTPEMVLALIDRALSTRFVDPGSAALVQHVADLSAMEGAQGDKARSTTEKGGLNLVRSAAFVAYGALAGVSAGVSADIGTDISNHYELGEKAIDFLEGGENLIKEFIDSLPPDEAARLQSQIKDAIDKSSGPR